MDGFQVSRIVINGTYGGELDIVRVGMEENW